MKTCIIIIFLIAGSHMLVSQTLTGSIEGTVRDRETSAPLPGANIQVDNSVLGTSSGADGHFRLTGVPVGTSTLRVSMLGYQQVVKTDIVVGAQRTAQVTIAMQEMSIQADEVLVTAGFFNERADAPVSSIGFSPEEIRRAPGSGADVSRIILGLPSLAKVNDQSNSLIVRGGSPMENAFFVDGIEIPNINHFPTQGATGGPIGIISADLLDDVTFTAGGFSAAYGDKLSSVMEMRLREGSRSAHQSQLDLNFAGFGGMTEGPMDSGSGSYLISVRRSYLDLLVHAIDIGTSVAPQYGDVVAKLTADLSPGHTLTVLDIFSDDHNNPDRKTAIENKMVFYGNQDIYLNTAGVAWRALWSASVYSNVAASYTTSDFSEDYFETNSGNHLVRNRSHEGTASLSALLHWKIDARHSIELGGSAKYLGDRFDNFFDPYTDAMGNTVSALPFNKRLYGWKVGAYVNYSLKPVEALTVTAGVRVDHFSYNGTTTIAPRASVAYQADERLMLKASTGVYYQSLPMVLLSQNDANRRLKDPEAVQLIAGFDYLLTENTKLGLEAYRKTYRRFPIDPSQPALFLVDELFYRYGFFFAHGALTNDGRAESNGIELVVQKKLAEKFYGLASATYFGTRYRGGDDLWRDRGFDNRVLFSLEGGYKPNAEWEFSARWIAAGGVPYTPFDLKASTALERGVLDDSRINAARLPAYHCLNVRLDKRWHFSSTNLRAYLSVWNAYNRQNVAGYFWNGAEGKEDAITQWGLLPIFGVTYEF